MFDKPGRITVHTEYLLYDFISTLGNVGGTLGLFIGFSVSGLITFILNFFIKMVEVVQNWNTLRATQNKITMVQTKPNDICNGIVYILSLYYLLVDYNDIYFFTESRCVSEEKLIKYQEDLRKEFKLEIEEMKNYIKSSKD